MKLKRITVNLIEWNLIPTSYTSVLDGKKTFRFLCFKVIYEKAKI